ncbi:putative uncharacterized protein DDB_G0282499 [Oppia nitens]|uniref:putative uncharacterized protein DDB_G0282499 n=1 Tax=Oppia nitens TaxID=1686743 RepID=UPI0023DA65FC|nr:putative uncharacterized protein DDB_G0282499 [Oppia nitens]
MQKRKNRSRNTSKARNLTITDLSVVNDTQTENNLDYTNVTNLTLVNDPMLTNTNVISLEQVINNTQNISNDICTLTNITANPILQANSKTNALNNCTNNVPNNSLHGSNTQNNPKIISNITCDCVTNAANTLTNNNQMFESNGKHEFKSIITVGSVTPQNFDGSGDIDDWIDHYTYIAKCNKWSNNMKKLRLPVHLKGMAEMWYRNFVKLKTDATYENKLSLDDIYEGLKSAFSPKNYRSFQQLKLITRYQQLNESVSNYYYDIIRLCEKLNPLMDEQEKLTHIMRGLRSGMLEKVVIFEPKDCIDLLSKLKSIEESEFLSQIRQSHNYLFINSVEHNEQSLNKFQKQNESQINSTESQNDISKLCSMFEQFMNKYRNYDSYRYQYRQTVEGRPVCDFCHKPGHLARSCYHKRSTTIKSATRAILQSPGSASADQVN